MKKSLSKRLFPAEELAQRRADNQFRELKNVESDLHSAKLSRNGKNLINFCSNDYLGLASHPEVIKKSVEYTEKYGAGSTASRLVSGNLKIHEKLEQKIAQLFGFEAALLFNSGFQANTTVLAAVANRNSLIIADKKAHNSLLQGAILSRAELKRFHHNDYNHLERLLKSAQTKSYNRIWVVTETLFSMDGDESDIEKISYLAKQYGAFLYADDAHAIGVFGKKGLGLNFAKKGIDISVGTFGKAVGVFGAFVGCSQDLRDYLVNFCTGFIYSTALPPAVIGAVSASLQLIPEMEREREKLLQNSNYVREQLQKIGFDVGASASQIIPVILNSEEAAISLSQHLEDNGIWASAIRPPTVEPGASRIRLTLTSKHSSEDINTLLEVFRKWK